MKLKFLLVYLSIPFFFQNVCAQKKNKPNVILIMGDDIGFECIGINGSETYSTPILDSLSLRGIRFTNTYSQPLCTPSRIKIMTGKPNYENYEYFSYLGSDKRTFGNLFKENGYRTSIVGKWQLNGLKYKLKDYEKMSRPNDFGFDEYSLWQLTEIRDQKKERFVNPKIEQNGKILKTDYNDYGPDIVSNYAIDFIKRNKNVPFFIYYPMLLVHDPFSPTPDSKIWKDKSKRTTENVLFYGDMVSYMDKIIGKIINELKKHSILENTLLIFIGDNGSHPRIVSFQNGKKIKGAKGNTIKYGNHVPMFVNWDSKIKNSFTTNSLIGFEDFYSTFEDILGIEKKESCGRSFLNLLNGDKYKEREVLTSYYDPRWSPNVDKFRAVYSQTKEFKLYKNGNFFNILKDPLELKPHFENLTKNELDIKKLLQRELDKIPDLEINSKTKWEKERIKYFQ
jgi:arylsulfatase A